MATTPMILAQFQANPHSLPTRGVVVGLTAVGIAACAMRFAGASLSWGDGAILASLAVASLLGASEARRLVAARERVDELAPRAKGEWMKVVIGLSGPADTAGAIVVPLAPPRNDPERRSLTRRAEKRNVVAGSRR